MEVLLVGNTGYVTETFIEESFPECYVVVLGNEMLKSNRKDCKYFIIPAKKPMPPFLSPTGKYIPAESALMFPLILFPVSVLRNI